MALPQIVAIAGAVLLALVMIFQVLLAAGLPLGRAAWGGEHRVLPPRLRRASLSASPALGAAAWILLARVGLVEPGADSTGVRVLTWIFVGLFSMNTLGNLASKSRTERYLMTPATLILVGCFLVAGLSG